MDLQWTSIPSRGNKNTPSRFMLRNRDKLRELYEPVDSTIPVDFQLISIPSLNFQVALNLGETAA